MKTTNKIFAILLTLAILASSFAFMVSATNATYSLIVYSGNGNVEVKIDGAVKHSGGNCTLNVAKGAQVTITASKKTADFMFWTDENLNVCGEKTEYSFTMVGPKHVQAWFGTDAGTMIVYRNTNTTKQILACVNCIGADNFTEHLVEGAVKFGYSFKEWSMTVEEIKAEIAKGTSFVAVEPVYEKLSATNNITVVNGVIKASGTTSATLYPSAEFTLVANNAPAGKKFIGWKNADGKYVSDSTEFTCVAMGDDTYTAVFVDESSNEIPEVSVDVKLTVEADGTLRLWSLRFLPDNYKMISYGFIYGNYSGGSVSTMTFENAESAGLYVAEYTTGKNCGILTCTSQSRMLSARAFITYTDGSNVYVVYSDVVNK